MMNNNRFHVILLTVSVVLSIIAVFFIKELPGDFTVLRTRRVRFDDSTALERLALINSAVKAVPLRHHFEYTGGFENPFKSWNEIRLPARRVSSAATAKATRTKFMLKGILTKNRPLAILEDGLGETYIRGIGEKALDQTVVLIADNRVTLRDHLGTYVLIVEEH